MTTIKEPSFLHFQDLVDQARQSIQTYCPEWTELNLSDPGITLIELFASMTTQLNYRINRVPERNYLKFLKMVGISPAAPKPAQTELTFYLAAPFPLTRVNGELDQTITTTIERNTEVATRRSTGDEEEVIFITERKREISPPLLRQVRQKPTAEGDGGDLFRTNYLHPKQTREGVVYSFDRKGVYPFDQDKPVEGNTFYLGFDDRHDISGYLLQLSFDCVGEGVGITPDDPPWIWEGKLGDQKDWKPIAVEQDTTKGLTLDGFIKLHLPVDLKPAQEQGISAYWVRCRLHQEDEGQMMYSESPKINDIQAFVAGLTVPAIHSAPIRSGEELGPSSGEPGQCFTLVRRPVLTLDPAWDEFVEVEEEFPDGSLQLIPWQQVEDFSHSDAHNRHFVLDQGSGEIRFGPAVRQRNGEVRQYGAIPKLGRRIQIRAYRTGGGTKGNVPTGSLRVLKKPISYIVEVSNRIPATGGQDQESLEEAKLQAQEKLRGQTRAVTPDDYERLCQKLDYVARVKCLDPNRPGSTAEQGRVTLLVVPEMEVIPAEEIKPLSPEDLSENAMEPNITAAYEFMRHLRVDPTMQDQLHRDLEKFRVLGITLDIREPTYVGVKIAAKITKKPFSDFDDIKEAVTKTLKQFINPLAPKKNHLGSSSQDQLSPRNRWTMISPERNSRSPQGWPFGEALYISEVYNLIRLVPGVVHVTEVELSSYGELRLENLEAFVTPTTQKVEKDVIKIPDDGLLYLIDLELEEVNA